MKHNTNEIKVLGRILHSTGKIHQQQEVYDINGIAPTCKATHYKNPIKILILEKKNVVIENDSNRQYTKTCIYREW